MVDQLPGGGLLADVPAAGQRGGQAVGDADRLVMRIIDRFAAMKPVTRRGAISLAE